MNFYSKKITTRNWLVTGVLFGILLALGISVIAFSEPTLAPPGGNAPAPINVSGTAQTKTGKLNIGGGLSYWITKIGDSFALQNNAGDTKFIVGQDGNVGIGTTDFSAVNAFGVNVTPKFAVGGLTRVDGLLLVSGGDIGTLGSLSNVPRSWIGRCPAGTACSGSVAARGGDYFHISGWTNPNFGANPDGYTKRVLGLFDTVVIPTGPLSFGASAGNDKIYLYDAAGDKYGFGIAASELRMYAGAPGGNANFITFGNFDGTNYVEAIKHTLDAGWGVGISLNAGRVAGGREWLLASTGGNAGQGQGKFVIYDQNGGGNVLQINSGGRVGVGKGQLSLAGNYYGWANQECIDCGDAVNGNPMLWLTAQDQVRVRAPNGLDAAKICLGGDCKTAWSQVGGSSGGFGGMYTMLSVNGGAPFCSISNPKTGGCSCPAGNNSTFIHRSYGPCSEWTCSGGTRYIWDLYMCWQ